MSATYRLPRRRPASLRCRPLLILTAVTTAALSTGLLAPAAKAEPSLRHGIPAATAPRPAARQATATPVAVHAPRLTPAPAAASRPAGIPPLAPAPARHGPPQPVPRTGAAAVTPAAGRMPRGTIDPQVISTFPAMLERTGYPPDPDSAAGPANVVTSSNSQLQILSRSGRAQAGTEPYWKFLGTSPSAYLWDPHVIYDTGSGRFMITVDGASSLWLAVSATSDARGSWCIWNFNGPGNGIWPATSWADYPQIGTDNRFIYLTANIYAGTPGHTGPFQYARLLELNKHATLGCAADSRYNIWSNLYDPGTGVLGTNYGDQPAYSLSPELDQSPGSPFSGGHLADSYGNGGCDITLWTLTGMAVSSSQQLTSAQIPVRCYSPPVNAPQKDSSIQIDTGGDSKISQVTDQYGILYFSLTSSYDWHCGGTANDVTDWFQLDAASQRITASGSFGAPCTDFFEAAPQPLGDGNTAFGFEVSGPAMYPDSGYIIGNGNGDLSPWSPTYASMSPDTADGNPARWGDFTGNLADPLNPATPGSPANTPPAQACGQPGSIR
jgi:hypothetical protein